MHTETQNKICTWSARTNMSVCVHFVIRINHRRIRRFVWPVFVLCAHYHCVAHMSVSDVSYFNLKLLGLHDVQRWLQLPVRTHAHTHTHTLIAHQPIQTKAHAHRETAAHSLNVQILAKRLWSHWLNSARIAVYVLKHLFKLWILYYDIANWTATLNTSLDSLPFVRIEVNNNINIKAKRSIWIKNANASYCK